jgi:hypothetical protein
MERSGGGMKVCRMCNQSKPVDAFHRDKNRKDGYYVYCKVCVKRYQQTGLRLVGGMEYRKKFYAENRDRLVADMKRRFRLKRYGVTQQQFIEMLMRQGHQCAICHDPLDKPYVDHDHASGTVRGLLCGACNSGIGMLKESTDVLRAAITYIEANGAWKKTVALT